MKIILAIMGSLSLASTQGRTSGCESDIDFEYFRVARGAPAGFGPAIPHACARHDEFSGHTPRNAATGYVAIGVGMVRNARVTCQNNCRLIASATEWAVPGRMMNWRSPFGSLL